MSEDYQALLDLARGVAAEAASLIEQMRSVAVEVAGTKSSVTDVVTRADLASERLIRERILAVRPTDGFIGEEGRDVVSSSGVTWVADPIDGTVNYLYGIPYYAVSIAAQVEGTSVAAVVRAPALGKEYRAVRGGGACVNDREAGCSSTGDWESALVATGFGYEASVRESQARATAALLPQVRDIRRLGSCALDICAVATGAIDAYVESGPHLWDHAAASLIAQEAGARFELVASTTGRDLLVCAPASSFDTFLELVNRCGF